MKIWLTQAELRVRLREELGLRIGPDSIHTLMDQGMPSRPFGKRSKFCWAHVVAWLETPQSKDPTINQVRDSLFRRRLKKPRK